VRCGERLEAARPLGFEALELVQAGPLERLTAELRRERRDRTALERDRAGLRERERHRADHGPAAPHRHRERAADAFAKPGSVRERPRELGLRLDPHRMPLAGRRGDRGARRQRHPRAGSDRATRRVGPGLDHHELVAVDESERAAEGAERLRDSACQGIGDVGCSRSGREARGELLDRLQPST
jgi:hypothetical protein